MSGPAPAPADVLGLAAALRVEVPAAYGDLNGHLNVRHHLSLHDDAGWSFFDGLGFGPGYVAARGRSFFDLEHHLRYLDEVLVGDTVTVHVRLLGRSAKVVHLISYLVDRSRGRVASTLELTTAHVDLATRRAVALDPTEAGRLDARLAADATLAWPAGTCGALGLRGPAAGPASPSPAGPPAG